jgi:sulfatase modifying factor 1
MKHTVFIAVSSFLFVACSTNEHAATPSAAGTEPNLQLSAILVHPRCPSNMVEVEGDYCTNATEKCLTWVNLEGKPTKDAVPGPGQSGRCGEFQRPTSCAGPRVHMHFCVDVYEYPNVKGQRPQSWMSWYDAKHACEVQGKRLLTHSEWTFAMEGPDMKPYPYGDGYHRDRVSCNTDNRIPKGVDVFNSRHKGDKASLALDDMLVPAGSMPACVSPFGVFDGVGNIDEWVVNENGHPYVSGLVGGHIFGVRNASRPMTEGHGPTFAWYETGTRCGFSL